jgi:hypothetical protein
MSEIESLMHANDVATEEADALVYSGLVGSRLPSRQGYSLPSRRSQCCCRHLMKSGGARLCPPEARTGAMARRERTTWLVAFALLASAAIAAAEGVWVLWLTPIADNPPRWGSSFLRKFHTLEDCDRHAASISTEFNLMFPSILT